MKTANNQTGDLTRVAESVTPPAPPAIKPRQLHRGGMIPTPQAVQTRTSGKPKGSSFCGDWANVPIKQP